MLEKISEFVFADYGIRGTLFRYSLYYVERKFLLYPFLLREIYYKKMLSSVKLLLLYLMILALKKNTHTYRSTNRIGSPEMNPNKRVY
jgi:hypothetical protein